MKIYPTRLHARLSALTRAISPPLLFSLRSTASNSGLLILVYKMAPGAESSTSSSEKWGVPHLTLSGYLRFWSIACYLVTFWLLFFKKEVPNCPFNPPVLGTESIRNIG